jgi:hypothetical protein
LRLIAVAADRWLVTPLQEQHAFGPQVWTRLYIKHSRYQ